MTLQSVEREEVVACSSVFGVRCSVLCVANEDMLRLNWFVCAFVYVWHFFILEILIWLGESVTLPMTCRHISACFSMMEDTDLEIIRHNNINTIVAIITIIMLRVHVIHIYEASNGFIILKTSKFLATCIHAHLHLCADRYATHSYNKQATNQRVVVCNLW